MSQDMSDLLKALTGFKELPKPPLQKLFDSTREIQKICATEGAPNPNPGQGIMQIKDFHTLSKADVEAIYKLAEEVIEQLAEASIRMYEFIEQDLLGGNMSSRVQQQMAIQKLKQTVSPEEFTGLMNKAAEDYEKVTGKTADSIREWTNE